MRSDDLEFTSHLKPIVRIFLLVGGLVPMLAPYELLMRPKWNTFFSPFFLISLLISSVAVGVGLVFIAASIFGLDEVVRFDTLKKEVSYYFGTPVMQWRGTHYSFSEISEVLVEKQTWDSGPDTYRLRLNIVNDRKMQFGEFLTVNEADKMQAHVRRVLELS